MNKIIVAFFFSVLTVVFATASATEYRREISKEFSVSSSPNLHIDNKYGNIRVIEGKENKITFKIEIVGKGSSEKLAKEYAEAVSIDFSQNANSVSAETKLASINCNNCGRSIHYTVIVPKSTVMDLDNKYGNIYLEDVITPLQIQLKYGEFQANSLVATNMDVKYGKATITSCSALNLDSKYSVVNLSQVEMLKVDSKYDKFNIGVVSDFDLVTGYTDVKINKLNRRFIANDYKYCKLTIEEIATNFSEIKIDAAYSTLNIGLTKNHNFKAALYSKYGKIKTNDLTIHNVSLEKEGEIVGIAGKNSNPSASVEISTSYGDIIFKEK